MTEIQKTQPLSIDYLRRGVKAQLHQLDPGLRVIAENIMGLASPIDLVTVNDHGDVILMLLALEGESDAALLTRSLAQRAWIAARVGDWAKLAPELKISPDAPVRAILLAPSFATETRAASRSLRAGIVRLVRYTAVRAGPHSGLLLETVGSRGPSSPEGQQGPVRRFTVPETAPPLPAFRSNLRDSDLGLKSDTEESLGE